MLDSNKNPSTESTSGPFNRGFFVWLNSLLITGWATVLTLHDLPAIYEKLSSEKLAVIFSKRWDKGMFFYVSTSSFHSSFSANHAYS